VDRSLPRSKPGTPAINNEVVDSDVRHLHQQTPAEETAAGFPESDWLPVNTGHVQAENTLTQRSAQTRTFQSRKICPTDEREKAQAYRKKYRTELSENFLSSFARTKPQKSHPRSRGNRQKGNEDGKRNRQDNEIDDCCGKPNPESRMAQPWRRSLAKNGCGLGCQNALSYLQSPGLRYRIQLISFSWRISGK